MQCLTGFVRLVIVSALISAGILGIVWYLIARAQPKVLEQPTTNAEPEAATSIFQILEPIDGLVTTDQRIVVSGRATPGQYVLLTGSAGELRVAQARVDGVFSAELELVDGPNAVSAAIFPPNFYAIERHRTVIRRTDPLTDGDAELLGEIRHVDQGQVTVTAWAGPQTGKLITVALPQGGIRGVSAGSPESGLIARFTGRYSSDDTTFQADAAVVSRRPDALTGELAVRNRDLTLQPRESWRQPLTLTVTPSTLYRAFRPGDGTLETIDRRNLPGTSRVLLISWSLGGPSDVREAVSVVFIGPES